MKKYISLSKYPGKQGKYYYTEFFKLYNIDAVYEPLGTDNLKYELDRAREQNIAGISVSMPFKQEIIKHLDVVDGLVEKYETCNTVVNVNGQLHGYNCDYAGAEHVISDIKLLDNVTVLGAGSMGTMIFAMLNYNAKLVSPRLGNWSERHEPASVVINCTNQGTATQNSPLDFIPDGCRLIVDLTVNHCELAEQAKSLGIKYLSGQEFYKYQFLNQFKCYTGLEPNVLDYETIRLART
jgi:shikimate 5-dehydrogenase